MTSILIPTIADDVHAASVSLVLRDMGHSPIRWFGADYPRLCSAWMLHGADGRAEIGFRKRQDVLLDGMPDVFWNRRLGTPTLDNELNLADKAYALRESQLMLQGLYALISERSFAVNPSQLATRAENKLCQLVAAQEVGLKLPPTLVSNDPAKIHAFLEQEEAKGGAIFKPFRPILWKGAERQATLYTSRVDRSMLPEDQVLQLAPGIYQKYVQKQYELRVTCMGHELIVARLNSQATRSGKVDWRAAQMQDLLVCPGELPLQLQQQCHALLDRLGLVFGCIDFIVTPEGEHIFLEINQTGQFLWVEELCPELPALDTFCRFLLSRDQTFRRDPSAPVTYRFEAWREASKDLLRADMPQHVARERPPHVVLE